MAEIISIHPRTASCETASTTILLDSGEVCEVVVDENYGVAVFKKAADGQPHVLYDERVPFRAVTAALGLSTRYLGTLWPSAPFDFWLGAFASAILNCQDCATVAALLHEATEDARQRGIVYSELPMPPPSPRSAGT